MIEHEGKRIERDCTKHLQSIKPKHQLEHGMYCVPKDGNKAIEVLSIANELGFTLTQNTIRVMNGTKAWTRIKLLRGVSFYENRIYAMKGDLTTNEIPVEEFISRLKGEWDELGSKIQ
jgi:hypothetical protein